MMATSFNANGFEFQVPRSPSEVAAIAGKFDMTKVVQVQDRYMKEAAADPKSNFWAAALTACDPIVAAHEKIYGITNISVRQDALRGRTCKAFSGFVSLMEHYFCQVGDIVIEGGRFAEVHHPEIRGTTFAEGPEYGEYALEALRFMDAKCHGFVELTAIERDLSAYYENLTAPTGQRPLPECRATTRFPFAWPKGVRYFGFDRYKSRVTAAHVVVSVEERAWLMINLDRLPLEHRRNLHVKPAFGSFVLWAEGAWVKGAEPHFYEGYSNAEILREHTRYNTPKGIFDATWRAKAPSCNVVEVTRERIIIDYALPRRLWIFPGKKVRREFWISDTGLVVVDNGKGVFHHEWGLP